MDAYISDISLVPQVMVINVLLVGMILLLGAALLPDENSDTWMVRLFQSLRIKRTRLTKVIRQKGASVDSYLNALSIEDIKAQRNNCVNCRNAYFCDRQRARQHLSYGDLAFCPNRESLAPILKRTGAVA